MLEQLRGFIGDTLREWQVPGASVGIVQDGRVMLCEGFGTRDLENGWPVTEDTLFQIGSCTKAFTAMALGLLVDNGKLEWDTPIQEYLPAFRLRDPVATAQMTARDLLTHRSGLPAHDLVWVSSNASRDELFRRLRHLEPSCPFRTTLQYSNLMYMVAGILVESIAGMSWEHFTRTRIFDRLGMAQSNFSTVETRQSSNFAAPHSERKGIVREIPFFEADGEKYAVGPAGSINSTAREMVPWLQLHISHGMIGGEPFISAKNLDEMYRPHIVWLDPLPRQLGYKLSSYGFGWEVHLHKGQVLIGHGGGIDGFRTRMSFLPDANVGVVVLSNLTESPAPQIITLGIYERLLNLDRTDWSARFRRILDETQAAAAHERARLAREQKLGTHPSHPLADYLGDYEHPGYGILSIRQAGDALRLALNDRLTTTLRHCHYDIFQAQSAQGGTVARVSFFTDWQGNISQVAAALQPGVDDIVFTRLPST